MRIIKYAGILHTNLSLLRGGEHVKCALTPSLSIAESANAIGTGQDAAHPVHVTGVKDLFVEDILRHMPYTLIHV